MEVVHIKKKYWLGIDSLPSLCYVVNRSDHVHPNLHTRDIEETLKGQEIKAKKFHFFEIDPTFCRLTINQKSDNEIR